MPRKPRLCLMSHWAMACGSSWLPPVQQPVPGMPNEQIESAHGMSFPPHAQAAQASCLEGESSR